MSYPNTPRKEPEPSSAGTSRLLRSLVQLDSDPLGGEYAKSYEREVSDAVARNAGLEPREGRIYLPLTMPQSRDLSAAGTGNLVGTGRGNGAGIEFMDSLQQTSVIFRAGALPLPITRENASIPKVTTGPSVGWLANETAAAVTSDPTIGAAAAAPKMLAARATFSRQLAVQSGNLVERMLMRELGRVVAAELDRVALAGSGASGEPLGVAGTAGIQTAAGTSISWAGVNAVVGDVRESRAAGEPAFISTPAIAELLATRERATGSGRYLREDDRTAGRPHFATMSAPTGTLFCADWSNLYVATWSALEIAVDPFTGFRTGLITMRVILPCDIVVVHPSAFVTRTSVT